MEGEGMINKDLKTKYKREFTDQIHWKKAECEWCKCIFVPNRRYQKFCCANHGAYASRVRVHGSLENYYKKNYLYSKEWIKQNPERWRIAQKRWRVKHDSK